MSTSGDLLIDAFGRIREVVHEAVEGLEPEDLAERLDPGANSIAWLVWHLTRIQDDHIADAAEMEQVWVSEGWPDRFDLPFSQSATGYGHSRRDVGGLEGVTGDLLLEYHDAVQDRTIEYLSTLKDKDYDRVVDDSWTPAVTLGIRLISVISDDLQHAGQAAFIRGSLSRR